MTKKRAMTSEQASLKKLRGHELERIFARRIGGVVNAGHQTDKKDVLDRQHRFHSVKGGEWWQIFLYSRSRLVDNTIFQGLGNVAQHMIACIDAFPNERDSYIKNKPTYKIKLQDPMRLLAEELQDKTIFKAFVSKAFFNAGEVQYLSVFHKDEKKFYIFWHQDVIDVMAENIEVVNSKAQSKGQYDCQKVLFRYKHNISEIEVRTDSNIHYKQIKCRFNAEKTIKILAEKISKFEKIDDLYLYGKSTQHFKI